MNSPHVLVMCLASLLCFAQPVAAEDKPIKLVESRDVPMETTVVYANRVPSQCTGGLAALFNTCVKVWAVASQPFDKTSKKLRLGVNVIVPSNSNNHFSNASLVFAIDGHIVETTSLDWEEGDPYFVYGTTATMGGESLAHEISTAREVWVSVMVQERISIRLNPKQLEAIKAVVDRYDSMEPK